MNRMKGIMAAVASGIAICAVYAAYSLGGSDDAPVKTHSAKSQLNTGKEIPARPQAASTRLAPLSAPLMSNPTPGAQSASQELALQSIESAAVSYDPAELPRIQPYLTDPRPEIRAAALNGVVVLGHASAAPMLRAAARALTDPAEVAKLMETADYLELPPAPVRRFQTTQRRSPVPNGKPSPTR